MDQHLLAAFSLGGVRDVGLVIIALGMVIFVHELGHFIVAKLCGVKCEKFYLGFDAGGLKLLHFRYGETEYGIGIIPLGGYVKMLGQEDNPARLREELERAKAHPAPANGAPPANAGAAGGSGGTAGDGDDQPQLASPEELRAAEQALYDPRSFLAKSVPKRMAIISAGVVMNLIFAFVTATVAFSLGVKRMACGVGGVAPGGPAWKAGLQPGDQILEIAGRKMTIFNDLMAAVRLGDVRDGLPVVFSRPGGAAGQTSTVTLFPREAYGYPQIGVAPPVTNVIGAILPGSAAANAKPALRKGDKIIQANGVLVKDVADVEGQLASSWPQKTLTLKIERPPVSAAGDDAPLPADKTAAKAKSSQETAFVDPNPMRVVGLAMGMGKIVAVQKGSPAEKAGLQADDFIQAVDNEAPLNLAHNDPLRLREYFRKKVNEVVRLKVEREGSKQSLEFRIVPRQADWMEEPLGDDSPVSIPELGIAYRVLNRVQRVADKSPAAEAGIKPGDIVVGATLLPPDPLPAGGKEFSPSKEPVKFDETHHNWPLLMALLQQRLPGTSISLELENRKAATLLPVESHDWFNPDRGIFFEPEAVTQRAASAAEALSLGWHETADATTMVFGVLSKLGGQISIRGLSGPVGIFSAAMHYAQEGIPALLLFMTMLGANLAVLNFLPIPVLDGGHMVFLLWEGIRGKPADERLQLALTYAGLLFILGLTVFVLGLDLHFIARP